MKRKHNFRFNIPLLNDPMSECYDLEVEREYRHIILGNMIHFMLNFNFIFANFAVVQVHLNVWPNSPNFLISKNRSKTTNIRFFKTRSSPVLVLKFSKSAENGANFGMCLNNEYFLSINE